MNNILYFHKKRILIGLGFCTAYGLLCKKTTNHPSEAVRLGIAGSIGNMICECGFHIIDTVNIRSKVVDGKSSDASKSTWQQVRQIYTKEGVFGFGRGFSACFYGSIFCGFTFFSLYKLIKLKLYEIFGVTANPTMIFFIASIFAELATVTVHFPYDMIKCRL